jgi:hypothetical protein
MSNRPLLIAVVLILSSFALAQRSANQQKGSGGDATDTQTCAATFTSGSGHNATSYCVTVNGNIVQFSRDGDEYLSVGGFADGYGICDATAGGVVYYDYAFLDTGNWGAASFSSTATKAISIRTTSDGLWQITNTITKVAANGSGPGSAKVAMKIRNLTGINRTILFLRWTDVDFKRSGVSDFNNDFDYTIDTGIGLEPGFASGLSVTNNTFTFSYDAFAQPSAVAPNPCGPFNVAGQPFFGDGSVVQLYSLTVPKLATKTINVTYKPI